MLIIFVSLLIKNQLAMTFMLVFKLATKPYFCVAFHKKKLSDIFILCHGIFQTSPNQKSDFMRVYQIILIKKF